VVGDDGEFARGEVDHRFESRFGFRADRPAGDPLAVVVVVAGLRGVVDRSRCELGASEELAGVVT
jgi:hypothetical protein